MKNCKSHKKRRVDKNPCPYCKAMFLQKYNRDEHVRSVHQDDNQVYVGNNEEVMEEPEEIRKRTSQESTTFLIFIEHNESVDCLSKSITKETEEKKRRTTKRISDSDYQQKEDIRKYNERESTLKLLMETFGDFIHHHKFISWLSSKKEYYTGRLKFLINSTKKSFVKIIHFQISFLMNYTHFG